MEYLSRLSGLVSTPSKAGAGISATPRLRKKPSLHPVGSVDIFHADWLAVQGELENPDERALFHGVARSDLPRRLQRIIDALVFESNRSNDGHTGPCMEYLLKYDILTELVHLSVDDRPKGIRGETIRALKDLIILMDEKFLSRQAANKPVSQLIQLCLDEDAVRYQLDDDSFDMSGSNAPPSAAEDNDYEEDLVDLMCHIASRIRNTPDLLQIFFTDESVDDADNTEDARGLKDGSIIVSRKLFDSLLSDDRRGCEASKIALTDPEADPAMERPASPADSVDSTATIQPATAQAPRKQSKRRLRFPLFSYLLKFVHREGRIGELARAGLLFLISLEGGHAPNRSTSPGAKGRKPTKRVSFGTEDVRRSLAVFIAHSDFADVLGAGLGAAYGLLPSRIRPVPRYDPTEIDGSSSSTSTRATITLASSMTSEASNGASEALASATQSDDSELQAQLRLMVDLMEFCQDVLDSLWLASKHLTEAANAAPIASNDTDEKAARREFSPSPAASPDLDPMIRKLAGAIAIAIRDTFIRNVVYPSLMESSDFDGSSAAVLSYLDVLIIVFRSGHILTDVALDFLLPAPLDEANGCSYGQSIGVPVDDSDRYSVKDLILDSLEDSKRPATRVAAWRLARSLLVCHGLRASDGLLRLPPRKPLASSTDEWMPKSPAAEMERDDPEHSNIGMHFREIDGLSALLASFESKESSKSMQASLSNYLLDAEQALRQDSMFSLALDLGGGQISLARNDPFVQQLFADISSFFSQPVEVNLAASGVLSALAASPMRSVQGWLTHPPKGEADGPEPGLLQLLAGLAQQVTAYRIAVSDFDRYLAERRRSLMLTEDLSAALNVVEPSGEDEGEAEAPTSLGACLTLPRLPSQSKGSSSRKQTPAQVREAERNFGIVEDKRASLAPLSPPSAPTALPANAAETGSLGRSSALARLFGGRATRTPSHLGKAFPTPSVPTVADARPGSGERSVSASTINPYADHFRETAAVIVKTQIVAGADDWRPPPAASSAKDQEGRATLSSVLDNTILLEELIKELLAIVQIFTFRSIGVMFARSLVRPTFRATVLPLRTAALHTTRPTLEEAALNRAERLKSRFWKTVTLQPPTSTTPGFQILLDGRSIKTPGGQAIIIPANRELLATCIAQEWSEQGKLLKPHTLPLTSLAARALEGCSDPVERKGVEEFLLRYLENETVCFQEEQPESLVKLQKRHWDPLLHHVNEAYGTQVRPFEGLLGNAHPKGTVETFKTHLERLDGFDLAAFERSVMLTKSFLISVGLVSGHLSVKQASEAAEVEVQSQIDRWGSVEDSHDVDQAEMRRTLGSVAVATVRN